jgi:NAD(P)-dependent dehydrogenase (short-subunit alcohol dehydrogenase family)
MGYCIVFLADEQSQFITGSTIRADGGAMMN